MALTERQPARKSSSESISSIIGHFFLSLQKNVFIFRGRGEFCFSVCTELKIRTLNLFFCDPKSILIFRHIQFFSFPFFFFIGLLASLLPVFPGKEPGLLFRKLKNFT